MDYGSKTKIYQKPENRIKRQYQKRKKDFLDQVNALDINSIDSKKKREFIIRAIDLNDEEVVSLVLEKLQINPQQLNKSEGSDVANLLDYTRSKFPLTPNIIHILKEKGAKEKQEIKKQNFIKKLLSSDNPKKEQLLLDAISFNDLNVVKTTLDSLGFTTQDLNEKFNPTRTGFYYDSPLIYALVKNASESIIELLIERGVKITSDDVWKDAIRYFTHNPNPVFIKNLIDKYDAPVQLRHIQRVDYLIKQGKDGENKKKRRVIRNMLIEKMLKENSKKLKFKANNLQKKLQSSEVSPNPKTIQNMKDLIKTQLGIQQQKQLKKQILELATIMNLSSSQKKKMWEDFLVDYYTKQSQGIPLKKWLWAWWKKMIKKFTS